MRESAGAPGAGARALHDDMTGLAIQHFGAAVTRDPSSASAWNDLGAAYDSLGRRDLARRAYARALALAPGSPASMNNMGASYQADGRHDLAVAMLRAATARDGVDPVIAANRETAERALAAAGGPPPKSERLRRASARASVEPYAPFRPRIERAGRGELLLITQPPPEPPEPSDVARAWLVPPAKAPVLMSAMPDYLAAPLRIDQRRAALPDAQAAQQGAVRP